MTFNNKDMTYRGLLEYEVKELVQFLEELVVNGKFPHPLPEIVQDWFDHFFPGDEDRKLLTISVVYPQKAMLSIIRYYQKELAEKPSSPSPCSSCSLKESNYY